MTPVEHAAIIEISDTLLLDILDFKGGVIHDIRKPKGIWRPDYIEIVIEHPDLPEANPAEEPPRIVPTYQQIYKRQIVEVSRISPKE